MAHAQFKPLSGLSIDTVIHAAGTSWNNETLATIMGALQKNIANGVAGLDTNGNVTAPLASEGTSSLLDPNGVPILVANPSQSSDTLPGRNYWNLMKPGAVLVGGTRIGTLANGDFGANSQLYTFGAADGIGGQGCLLCVVDTNGSVTQNSIGLNTAWVDGPTGIASYAPADGSIQYLGAQNREPELLFDVASYTATQIVLKTAMTPVQMERIHYGQYVLTNSVPDGSSPVTFSSATDLPTYPAYASIVVDVADPTHIDVKGWAIPGAGNGASGQVPDFSSLDTGWSNYGRPVAAIGGVTNVGTANWRLDISKAARPNSLTRGFGFAEFDLTNDLPTGEYNGRLFALNTQGNAPSADSFIWSINAPQYPVLFDLGEGPTAWSIRSNGFRARGNGGVSSSDADEIMFEHDGFTDSTDNMRLIGYLHHLASGTGVNGTEMYLGGYKSGTEGVSPLIEKNGGQGLGAVGFGIGGNPGQVSLCASNTSSTNMLCTLTVGADGNAVATQDFGVLGKVSGGTITNTNATFAADGNGNVTANGFIVSGKAVISSDGNATFYNNVTANAIIAGSGATKTIIGSDGSLSLPGNITGNALIVGSGSSKTVLGSDGSITTTALTGSGNAYACLNSSGQLYRSSTACN
ncbi:hypothetical protein [Gluconobacter roseus]|uniref:hypothetical protein n=1 Tax=Gluconobacter roseus TaxID=586239 RepID=UPI0038D16EA1